MSEFALAEYVSPSFHPIHILFVGTREDMIALGKKHLEDVGYGVEEIAIFELYDAYEESGDAPFTLAVVEMPSK